MSRYKQTILCLPYLMLMFCGLCVSLAENINNNKIFALIFSIEIIFTLLQIITNYRQITKTSIIFILYIMYLLYFVSLTIVLISNYNIKLNQYNMFIRMLNYILLIKWLCLSLLFFIIMGFYNGDKVLYLIIYTAKYSFSLIIFDKLITKIKNNFCKKQDIINNNNLTNIVIVTIPNNDECCICLCVNNGKWAILECKHRIHYECIKLWLDKSKTCPLCRTKI